MKALLLAAVVSMTESLFGTRYLIGAWAGAKAHALLTSWA